MHFASRHNSRLERISRHAHSIGRSGPLAMSTNTSAPSPHTTPSADEWLATWIVVIGMLFILCIFFAPWLFFTDDPFWSGWGGYAPQGTVVRYVPATTIAPTKPVTPAPPPRPPYVQVVRGTPVTPGRPASGKEPPRSAQVLSFASLVPDLSRLGQGARNNAPVAV